MGLIRQHQILHLVTALLRLLQEKHYAVKACSILVWARGDRRAYNNLTRIVRGACGGGTGLMPYFRGVGGE